EGPGGDGRVGGGQFACLADQGVAGAVLLPAAAVAARAAVAAGHDLHVPELAGDAVLAAFDLAVLQDRAADAGAQRDHHEVVLAASGAEAPLGPGGGVGVVVDQDGDGETAGEAVPAGLVAPGQVGGEEHPGAVASITIVWPMSMAAVGTLRADSGDRRFRVRPVLRSAARGEPMGAVRSR